MPNAVSALFAPLVGALSKSRPRSPLRRKTLDGLPVALQYILIPHVTRSHGKAAGMNDGWEAATAAEVHRALHSWHPFGIVSWTRPEVLATCWIVALTFSPGWTSLAAAAWLWFVSIGHAASELINPLVVCIALYTQWTPCEQQATGQITLLLLLLGGREGRAFHVGAIKADGVSAEVARTFFRRLCDDGIGDERASHREVPSLLYHGTDRRAFRSIQRANFHTGETWREWISSIFHSHRKLDDGWFGNGTYLTSNPVYAQVRACLRMGSTGPSVSTVCTGACAPARGHAREGTGLPRLLACSLSAARLACTTASRAP